MNKTNKRADISYSEDFTQLFGVGSYSSETITKGEYDRQKPKKKVFMHKASGERVW